MMNDDDADDADDDDDDDDDGVDHEDCFGVVVLQT